MENKTVDLSSGFKLHMSDAPWEKVVPLWSAVQLCSEGRLSTPDIGRVILASGPVQSALADLYPWATWDNMQITPGLFNEQKNGVKIRADQSEIWEAMMHFHLRFFLMNSSKSTASKPAPTESRK